MTIERFRELHQKRPLEPFEIHLADGRAPLSPTTYLVLDDGTQFDVAESELDRCRRALEV